MKPRRPTYRPSCTERRRPALQVPTPTVYVDDLKFGVTILNASANASGNGSAIVNVNFIFAMTLAMSMVLALALALRMVTEIFKQSCVHDTEILVPSRINYSRARRVWRGVASRHTCHAWHSN